MSIKVMSRVWDSAPVEGTELLLLLAMADYAHDDGGSIFPSVPTLAKRIRKQARQTQYVLRDMASRGFIERTGQMPDGRYVYRIVLEALTGGAVATAPVQHSAPGGCSSYDTGGGAITVAPKPLLTTVKEPLPLAPSREPYTEEFNVFWKAYPRTNGTKLEAFKAWKLVPKEDRGDALAGLTKWIASAHWAEGKIVFAERYLKRRMWNDEPAPPSKNGRVDDKVDKRPTIKPYVPGPAKAISAEKRAELARQLGREP